MVQSSSSDSFEPIGQERDQERQGQAAEDQDGLPLQGLPQYRGRDGPSRGGRGGREFGLEPGLEPEPGLRGGRRLQHDGYE